MTRHLLARTFTAVGLACAALSAGAANVSVSGNFVFNTDVAQITFRLDTDTANVNIWTDSWLAGVNFDPTAAVWAKVGDTYTLLSEVDDDDTIGAGQGAFDAGLRFDLLAAGDYLVTIAAAPNYANGPLLQSGFAFDGSTPITLAAWTQPSANPNFPDQKGGFWNVNLTNVSSVTAVPEPSTWAMLGAGLLISGLVARRRSRQD
ncbi:MAG: PEP-CTERM sorting domain-containing protein [Rhizobiales bacterium]|nr:PEP-CTERM sorting domain-containing protein [Rhizobacter sp.]